jgi:DNA topoisomerase-3
VSGQIVITEKSSQARDVRAAVGGRYGAILPAEGHLFDLQEPEDVVPAWKRWTAVLLRPDELYGTRPAPGGNKATKLKAIREALRTAHRVWLATDCDREGQLIGQEILEHLKFRGEVMRVMFTAQDPQTIRDSFAHARPNRDYAYLYAAAVARRQADQIYNLSLTRTATVTLARTERTVIGVGRVKTPTLAIVCRRELEIRSFVVETYYEVVATAAVAAGRFQMRHAPKARLKERGAAEAIAAAAQDFEGPLTVRVEDKRQGPPRLHDLPSLQKLCGSRFGWSAARTLEIAQELYDGAGKKIITYPRAEIRYLPESLIPDVPRIVTALRAGRAFAAIPVPQPPIIRCGASGTFNDRGLAGASHHAVIPNVNTAERLREIWPQLSSDERRLFDVIARSYLAAVMPDFRYRQTTASLDVEGRAFHAAGRQPIELGWRAAFPDWQPAEERGDDAQLLPTLRDGETTQLNNPVVESKETRPPPRYHEGTLIDAMQNAWRFVNDPTLRERLKQAKGIGTPATRAEIIRGLKVQEFLIAEGKHIVPTERGLALFNVLERADPALVDPGVTARMECLLDEVLVGRQDMMSAIDAVCDQATHIISRLTEQAVSGSIPPIRTDDRAPNWARRRHPSGTGSAPKPARPKRSASKGQTTSAKGRSLTMVGDATGENGRQDGGQRSASFKRSSPKRAIAHGTSRLPHEAKPSSRSSRMPSKGGKLAKASGKTDGSVPVSDTPLQIPYGNKETAQALGARYRAGGWYAPPGVRLDEFSRRGWL